VIRLGALGDVLRTIPAVHGLRALYPDAEISWLVEPPSSGAVEACPVVDRTLVFPRATLTRALRGGALPRLAGTLRSFVRSMRSERFDLVLDFHGLLKSGVLSRLCGAPRRIGFAKPVAREGADWFATDRARLSPTELSRYARNAGLLEFIDAGESGEPIEGKPLLDLDPEAVARINAVLGSDRAPIVLHPGSSAGAAYKRYPAARLGEVAGSLAAQTGRPCLVACGPKEHGLAQTVVAASGGGASFAPETHGFADLAALISRAALYVGGDSGPLHLASLLGVPVVQILGPTHPVENTPYAGTPWRRVHAPQHCSPCRRGCAAAHCMSAIAPQSVVLAGIELLNDTSSEAASRGLAGGRA
jgi:heptosyltransferase-1